jgi:hypothetical protein
MTSQRWSTLVSLLVFALVLATAGRARAQWGFPLTSGQPSVSPFGPQYGTGIGFGTTAYDYGSFGGVSYGGFGTTPSVYGSFGGLSYGGFGGIGAFPNSSYGLINGPRPPQATASFQSVSHVVTLLPGWSGSAHRVHRRHPAQPSVPRAVVRR